MTDEASNSENAVVPGLSRPVNLSCRMYEKEFPDIDELVMVQVTKIAEMGAYVVLLEYNNIEGMILLSELTRRRIRSINTLVRVGRKEVVMTMRVDEEKGYIDLSKRRVIPEEAAPFEEKYNKSKIVHSILRYVAESNQTDLKDLYEKFGWPLYRKFGHAYDAFKLALQDEEAVFSEYDLSPEIMKVMMKEINRRLTPQPVKLRADLEVTCFSYEGVDAIRTALSTAEAMSNDEMTLKVKLVAPPLYVLTTTTLDKVIGIELLNKAIEAVTSSITQAQGHCVVKSAPHSVSEREERDLSHLMEELERANMEVDGDEDHDSDSDTGRRD